MKLFKIMLELKSSIMSKLQGDTLWGHVCWGIRWRQGEDALVSFLEEYNNGEPPLIFSDGFPAGFIPVPKFPPDYSTRDAAATVEAYRKQKEAKRIDYLRFEFLNGNRGTYADVVQFTEASPDNSMRESEVLVEEVVTRNMVNRITGTTGDSALYSVTEYWPGRKAEYMEIYALTNRSAGELTDLIGWGIERGYGEDTSIGKGVCEIKSCSEVTIPRSLGGIYMALGSFIPSEADELKELQADMFTKYGKLGSPANLENTNPYKKPLLMYRAGATFSSQNSLQYIGTMMKHVHKNPRIVHHCYAPVWPIREGIK
jgi:CRISPR-associated protein Csm4